MKNIEKYNKYYGKSYDVRKIIYFVIILILIITFFFGPIGRVDSNMDIVNNNPTTSQKNASPIVQSIDKDSSSENKIKVPIENNKQENNKDSNINNEPESQKETKKEENENSQKNENEKILSKIKKKSLL